MLPARYVEPITLVFHCLRLDNWRAVALCSYRVILRVIVFE